MARDTRSRTLAISRPLANPERRDIGNIPEDAMVELFGKAWSRAELLKQVGHISQLGGVRLLASDNGPSRGVRLLKFQTGTGFSFEVAIDRGMDVGQCEYKGASLAWIPPTQLPGPWFFEDQAGFGWLRSALGGFNNTCGLVHIGNPDTAAVPHYNFPARPTDRYGVHDRAAMIPGELISFGEHWEGDSLLIEAVGRVTQAQAYGETLVLTRTYRAELGKSAFEMEDVVENAGFLPAEHMLLYHINAGYPLVDAGAEFIAPLASAPELLFGTANLDDPSSWSSVVTPQRNWVQQTFQHHMRPDANGRVQVAIVNPALFEGTALSVSYDAATMPNYIEWRMMGEGQYAVGIEPCTNGFGRDAVKRAGALIILRPGERRTYRTRVEIVEGAERIAVLRSAIGGRSG
jgi:hypothetical protein